MTDLRNLTPDEIIEFCLSLGGTIHQGAVVAKSVLRHGIESIDDIQIAGALRDKLRELVSISKVTIEKHLVSKDGSEKFIYRFSNADTYLHESEMVEGVLIPERSRLTLCISTQVGCQSGCRFCLTGSGGFIRNLSAAEMLGQVLAVQKVTKKQLTNLVLMGGGEPLENFDNVKKFVKTAADHRGLNIHGKKITLSTSGIIPGIERMMQEDLDIDIGLAVSLNAADDDTRSRIMPINRKYPLDELLKTLRAYCKRGRKVVIEYVLINSVNDSLEEAGRLTGLLEKLPCMINLLPFHPYTGSEFQSPEEKTVRRFQKVLLNAGFVCVVRDSRGLDIMAACGQLKASSR